MLAILGTIETDLEKLPNAYLVINTINDVDAEAVFTDIAQAIKYMNRIALNSCSEVHDHKQNISFDDFNSTFNKHIRDSYSIVHVRHLDLTKPIYHLRSSRHFYVWKYPGECVTNSLDKWISVQEKYDLERNYKEVLERFTIPVNPELPDFLIEA